MAMVGPYRLVEVVGRGASGEVWRASRVGGPSQVVALKRFTATGADAAAAAERLRHEAAVLAALAHPHIVPLVGVVDAPGECALAMGLAEGGSLFGLLDRRGPRPPGEVVAIIAPIAEALAAAHGRGVRHGDVKPANILLTGDGLSLLADFGAGGAGPTRHGSAATAGYTAPELRAGAAPDRADDVWALAVTAREALLGRRRSAWPTAADGADELLALLDRVVATGRSDRPTAGAFAAALRATVPAWAVRCPQPLVDLAPHERRVTGPPTRPFGPSPPTVVSPSTSRRPAVVVAAMVLVAVAVAGGVGAARAAGRVRVVGSAVVASRPRRSRACPALAPAWSTPAAGGQRLLLDLTGAGCAVPLVWRAGTAEVRVPGEAAARRYDFAAVGAPAGRGLRSGWLLVGDWDCDGTDGVAYYEPGTGEVHYFDDLPGAGRLQPDRRALIGRGRHPWVRAEGRCDTVDGGPPGSSPPPGSRVGAVGGPG